ncbi:hypothetical protein DdX_02520 [Ditylenchus destructor]|uniref:Uncharacterized protein n=1 Tax=Ditylenchus destructor TaxID=166010 RepID=A0AAD4RCB1_9BILA|nr:hypothetical protein DdX_02520 [Ditylenchus destructor]
MLLLTLCLLGATNAHSFTCLDECECNTQDRSIDCTNNFRRKELHLPDIPMIGYAIIGLSNTDVKSLPPEDVLLEHFPDLLAIHIKSVPAFNCKTLKNKYRTITILSDCNHDPKWFSKPTKDCDSLCQVKSFFLRAFRLIKMKYKDMIKSVPFLELLHNMLVEMGHKVASFVT